MRGIAPRQKTIWVKKKGLSPFGESLGLTESVIGVQDVIGKVAGLGQSNIMAEDLGCDVGDQRALSQVMKHLVVLLTQIVATVWMHPETVMHGEHGKRAVR